MDEKALQIFGARDAQRTGLDRSDGRRPGSHTRTTIPPFAVLRRGDSPTIRLGCRGSGNTPDLRSMMMLERFPGAFLRKGLKYLLFLAHSNAVRDYV